MHHDPRITAQSDATDQTGKRFAGRVARWFGRGRHERNTEEVVAIDAPIPDELRGPILPWPVASEPAPELGEDELQSLEALAASLAELIATAESRIDGAAHIVGRSAEEARRYGAALAHGAASIDTDTASTPAASALISITRAMIEQTRQAESRLRDMGAELDTLHRDLADARTCAERDQLTGLPNRRALEAALHRAVAATDAANKALSLAFCDVDHFKRINDTHGHALGDRVLRLVGDCLSDEGGEDVFVGRQGGEEFVMLFDGVSLDEAAERVDAIRERLAARELKSRTTESPIGSVTFSAGVAQLKQGETGEELLKRADGALYRAKEAGRNRVERDF